MREERKTRAVGQVAPIKLWGSSTPLLSSPHLGYNAQPSNKEISHEFAFPSLEHSPGIHYLL